MARVQQVAVDVDAGAGGRLQPVPEPVPAVLLRLQRRLPPAGAVGVAGRRRPLRTVGPLAPTGRRRRRPAGRLRGPHSRRLFRQGGPTLF